MTWYATYLIKSALHPLAAIGGAGAAIGGLTGGGIAGVRALASDDKEKLKTILKGALYGAGAGGLLGLGGGALGGYLGGRAGLNAARALPARDMAEAGSKAIVGPAAALGGAVLGGAAGTAAGGALGGGLGGFTPQTRRE